MTSTQLGIRHNDVRDNKARLYCVGKQHYWYGCTYTTFG